MASDEADIVMHSKLKKVPAKKQPSSPTADILKNPEKKASTKEMVNKALTDLKTRKGTSLYAIKKYIEEKYQTDSEKISYFIKKYLKAAVEAGTIVQTKGIGASGSFRLATIKNKVEKKKQLKKIAKKSKTDSESEKSESKAKNKSKEKKGDTKKVEKKKTDTKKEGTKKVAKKKEVVKKDAEEKAKPGGKGKKSKAQMVLAQTPAKKRAALIKRKSMGSIIKKPKMKPKINK